VSTIPGDSAEGVRPLAGTGLVIRDALPWQGCLQVLGVAQDTGYGAVFVPEIDGREAFATLAGFGLAAPSMRLGTGVVPMWSRSPAVTAMGAATVHELSGGRMVLGLGSGLPASAHQVALAGGRGPVDLLRDYVRAVRAALSGKHARGDGGFGTDGFTLSLPLAEELGPPPIWLAALGDRMVALAGEVGDGVLLNWCPPERVARARTRLAQAASNAGRDPAAITVAVYVRACLNVERAVALAALREMTGRYATIPHYRAQFEAMELGEAAGAAAAAFEAGRIADVPEELVMAVTVAGGRQEAVARFAEYRRAGADLVLCYPVTASLDPFSSMLGTVLAAAPETAVER